MATLNKTFLQCAELRDWLTLERNFPNKVIEYSNCNIFVTWIKAKLNKLSIHPNALCVPYVCYIVSAVEP